MSDGTSGRVTGEEYNGGATGSGDSATSSSSSSSASASLASECAAVHAARLRVEYKAAKLLMEGARRRIEGLCSRWFSECDRNESGDVSAAEFVSKILGNDSGDDFDTMRRALSRRVALFRQIDADGDYRITLDEMISFYLICAE